jgi:methionyl-tRNA synthetase
MLISILFKVVPFPVKKSVKKKFYVTTPLYYPTDLPHIGSAYTTIAADVLARFWRLQGADVWFLTGTDEHGQKMEKAAAAAGKEPEAFSDEMVRSFVELWRTLEITNNDFIRTTEPRHEKVVLQIFEKLKKKGDIYKGKYEGWYCVPDESFWTDMQVVREGDRILCPDCRRPVERLKEESYFFKLSKYQKKILDHIKRNPDFIQPDIRRNEIVNFINQGLHDLSISRTATQWGIPIPGDPKHVMYVWTDALVNYVSALGWPSGEKFKKFWPADVHLMGKEITRFHVVIWPAILMSAGIKLPKQVFAHGWWTVEGQKMSKSRGNVVDPRDVVKKYSADSFRYFLLREMPFGADGDYSEKAISARHNAELADDLGNLVNRTIVLVEKKLGGVVRVVAKQDADLAPLIKETPTEVAHALEKMQFNVALTKTWELIAAANKYINDNKPWAIEDSAALASVLYNLLETVRIIAILIRPFMPSTSDKIFKQLGMDGHAVRWSDAARWGVIKPNTVVRKGEILFTKVEAK